MYEPEKLKKRYSRISASALGVFEIDPKYFKNYIDGLVDEETPSFMELGTKLHMYLLEPEEFKKNYIYLDVVKPRGDKQKEFCELIANSKLKELQDSVINAYNLTYATKGKSEEKIKQEALKLYNGLSSYVEYVKRSKEYKDILNYSTISYLKTAKNAAEKHVAVKDMLFDEDSFIDKPNLFSKNEMRIYWEHPTIELDGEKLVLKSIIDRLVIDHEKKVIKLIDLKTSSNLHTFEESYSKYKYHRQMAFYWAAIHYYFKQEFEDKDIGDYSKETYIVAIQTPNNYGKDYPIRCKVFPVIEEDLNKGIDEIEDLLNEIKWHIDENKWEHSRSYYENNGLEQPL